MNTDVLLQATLSGLLTGCIYSLIAIGFILVFGVLNIVNFAHGSMVMLAMYFTFLLFDAWRLDPYLSMLIVAPTFFGLGLLLHKLLLSRLLDAPHGAHMMATLGVLIFCSNLANFFFGGTLRGINTSYTTASLQFGSVSLQIARTGAAVVALLFAAALGLFLARSDFGKSIRAAASNRLGAHVVGIDVGRVFLVSVALATAAAAVAGAAMMPYYLVRPLSGDEFLMKAFTVAVVGGMGSFGGAVLAGLLVGLVESLAGVLLQPTLTSAILFGLLILILLFKPSGLLGQAKM